MKKPTLTFVDCFSVGLSDLKQGDAADLAKVLRILAETGRFSCFEASDNPTIARTMTRLMHSDLVEQYTPEAYKAKPEPGGARARDQDTYPWTFVRLTKKGRALIG